MMRCPRAPRYAATIVVLTVYTFLVVLPVSCVLFKALHNPESANVLLDARQWSLLRNSLLLACGTSVLAGSLGSAAAYALSRAHARLRPLLAFMLAAPVLVPPHIMAIAWIDLLGQNGILIVQFSGFGAKALTWPGMFHLAGVIWTLGISWYPIVMAATLAALHRFDARLLEAARISGQGRRAWLCVQWPLTLPGVVAGMVLVFVISLVTFAVPSLLQVNTYPVEINALCAIFDYAGAAVQALPMAALCSLAGLAYILYVQPRYAWLTGRTRTESIRAHPLGALVSTAFCGTLILVALALPLGVTLARAQSLRVFRDVWATARHEMLTSLVVSTLSATLATALAFVLVTALKRRAQGSVLALSVLPLGITGGVFGLGLIALWNQAGPAAWIYDSLAVLVLGCAARFFVFAFAGAVAGTRRMDARLDEAGAVAGVPWIGRVTGIALPLLSPHLAAVWGLVFVLTIGEVDTSVLVCPPGQTTLAIRLFSLMHYGPDSYVAALSLLTVAIVFAVAACAAIGYGRLRAWTHARS